jgi:hypothetical protein
MWTSRIGYRIQRWFVCLIGGAVKIWDVRQRDKPVAVMAPKEGEPLIDTWSVAFGREHISYQETLTMTKNEPYARVTRMVPCTNARRCKNVRPSGHETSLGNQCQEWGTSN